jgi:hypothetical protein
MSWESLEKSADKGPISFGVRIILIVITLAVVIGVARFILMPVTQAAKVVEKTLDADNVIYNYEYFKQAYQDIGAIDKKIVTAQAAINEFSESAGSREKWDSRDKEESARLKTNLTGLQNVRNDMVATYNARAMMVNRSIFMGKDVPASVE